MGWSEYMLVMGLLCVAPMVVLGGVLAWLLARTRRDTARLDTARIRRG